MPGKMREECLWKQAGPGGPRVLAGSHCEFGPFTVTLYPVGALFEYSCVG